MARKPIHDEAISSGLTTPPVASLTNSSSGSTLHTSFVQPVTSNLQNLFTTYASIVAASTTPIQKPITMNPTDKLTSIINPGQHIPSAQIHSQLDPALLSNDFAFRHRTSVIDPTIYPRLSKQPLLSISLNGAMNAVAASTDGDIAVVAGREVLMTLRVRQDEVQERLNLRAGVRLNQNFSSNDVQWAGAYSKSVFATAATNSGVILWDLRKSSKEKLDRVITEHARAVNRISFHPTDPLLLTASQDGSVKLWDLRIKGVARHTFDGRAESVRDVQFVPTGVFEFAAAFENGSVQKWDIRNTSQYERKWNAHNGLALTIDWSSNGRFLASGSRDRVIKVWDTKSENRKAIHNIPTSAPVSRLKWRPGFSTQLASCALSADNRVHIWDISRSFVPLVSIEEHANITTGFLWSNPYTLWTCSKDKRFCVQDIQHGYKPSTLLTTSAHAWNVHGNMAFAMDISNECNDNIDVADCNELALNAEEHIPNIRQVEGIMLHNTLEHSAFVQLAIMYSMVNSNVWESCEHNAKLAAQLGFPRSAQTWKLIQILFNLSSISDDIMKPQSTTQSCDTPNAPSRCYNVTSSNANTGHSTPDRKACISNTTPLPISSKAPISNANFYSESLLLNWEPSNLVNDIIEYYADVGNVQMCVAVVLVLWGHVEIDANRAEACFWAYIDLLQRYRLWNLAVEIIGACPFLSLRKLNQESTEIHTSCPRCLKPILPSSASPGWSCEKCCKQLDGCVICRQPVRGLFTWNQRCSHGGHAHCLQEWYRYNSECPAGCDG
ncbi:hypothetical protein BDEG_28105 [Batrachochytrium dendrobatidis JEL423]|uniref:WDR59/RTC1-like RING zinc finger domain-containing protein n=1 Tax=Batrachochytrium dendrobatidis (strain JEL423) TaxID=403673 RepID=A0A177WZ59_BATDL|nr:hypothetical protein BDEG_28105 [Batrachochytrium dendrobatidis JEL423]